ncbi:MAG: sigma-70 family RNA polymerase sigma factor [Bacteroidetes bacterium]|nr:sigma-70 family RNA polymerase sigma factor [Bacteroidota bacterium]
MTEEEQNRVYWEGLRKGDKESFFSLYNNIYFHLVRWGLKITADDELVKDCVTQLFFQLWDKRHRLNPVDNVRAYLFTSLRRMLIEQLGRYSKVDAAITQLADEEVLNELSYEEIIVGVQRDEELRQKLHRALQQLSPRQIELIRLVFFEGLTYEEVAARTSQSIKTAYNTIYNAMQVLRRLLK